MLEFAIEYQRAVEMLSAEWNLSLQDYELTSEEWRLAEQLQDVLQVSST